ncbi:hypothetical protein PV08_07827 [Exophiala spinifera]|uniref:Uncharacterized protein n=1 Tax=Exophiala spinifera TaxID=91928 RepID=A0A0D2B8S0_9EURO|nr:uncharacterized protein PV08_07827 [Exophiala spinifera]KIW15040.1 hypothetical protein PV08_07827 [Exophiala spinifera]
MGASDEDTVSYSGNIPEAYAPPTGVELFSKKWWVEITTKDDFWFDLAYKVPKAVLKRRIKQNIVVDVDIRTRARKKEEERLARERQRAQALKGARSSREQDEPASPGQNSHTEASGSVVATGNSASLQSMEPTISREGMEEVSHHGVVKFECLKCGYFFLRAEMSSVPPKGLICKDCVETNAIKREEMPLWKSEVRAEEGSSQATTSSPSVLMGVGAEKPISEGDMEGAKQHRARRLEEGPDGSVPKRIKIEVVDNQ